MVLSESGQLPCHHKMVIGEITRSHQLVTRLKSLVLPSPPESGQCSPELASDLFDEVLQSYKVSISMLLCPCNCCSQPADVKNSEDIRALEEEEKNIVKEQPERIDISYASDSSGLHIAEASRENFCYVPRTRRRKESQSKTSTTSNLHLYGHHWRKSGKKKTSNGEIPREEQQSWTTITAAPHLDGHQWRKYGEKHISNSEFPRNYYRCSHLKDKKCQATKTIQQKEGSGERIRFVVTYKMRHTCKSMDPTYPLLVESATQEDSVISFATKDNTPRKKMEGSSTVPMLIDLNLTVQS